jgi:RimJ/RimL family protein N-acetyltransferase
MLRYIVAYLSEKGYGPFYGDATPDNSASIKGMEKAGFEGVGTWTGWRMLCDLLVRTRLLE